MPRIEVLRDRGVVKVNDWQDLTRWLEAPPGR
jgi:hypothetical protein